MTTPVVLVERHGPIAVLTLNRPDVLNAINAEVATRLGAALDLLDHDPELRVGVLTGVGRVFCAGADLKALAAGEPVHDPDHEEWGFAGITHHPLGKPLVAAVDGPALGGGMEMALSCDLVVAGTEAQFGLPEVSRGLLAGAGGLVRLPQQIPLRAAMEAALTGDNVSAETAKEWHLINRLVPAGDALGSALELAKRIASNAPLSVQAGKRLIRSSAAGVPGPELWQENAKLSATLLASRDAREGMEAFSERRRPIWNGC